MTCASVWWRWTNCKWCSGRKKFSGWIKSWWYFHSSFHRCICWYPCNVQIFCWLVKRAVWFLYLFCENRWNRWSSFILIFNFCCWTLNRSWKNVTWTDTRWWRWCWRKFSCWIKSRWYLYSSFSWKTCRYSWNVRARNRRYS